MNACHLYFYCICLYFRVLYSDNFRGQFVAAIALAAAILALAKCFGTPRPFGLRITLTLIKYGYSTLKTMALSEIVHILMYKQACKLGRCDSYLQNLKTLPTHPITDQPGRC